MPNARKVLQATLYPSEVVTIGILFALKGGQFRAFCRWLARDYTALFGGLPDRTTLLRQLQAQQYQADVLLAQASVLNVIGSYPIEFLFPIRGTLQTVNRDEELRQRTLVNWGETLLGPELSRSGGGLALATDEPSGLGFSAIN